MTHDDLVKRAERWLKNTLRCRVVLCELVAYTTCGEIPDAIGWVGQHSVLVECKTSRSDFLAEQRKFFRDPYYHDKTCGDWRFFLTPPGLVTEQDVPDGWGVYEVRGKTVRHVAGLKYANGSFPPFSAGKDSEVALLVSALSRRG